MRKILLVIFLFTINYTFCQDWTNEELEIIQEFDLSQTDNRGIILVKAGDQCNSVVPTILDAIKLYFVPDVRVDIITICITDFNLEEKYYNSPLGMKEVVELYLTIIK